METHNSRGGTYLGPNKIDLITAQALGYFKHPRIQNKSEIPTHDAINMSIKHPNESDSHKLQMTNNGHRDHVVFPCAFPEEKS